MTFKNNLFVNSCCIQQIRKYCRTGNWKNVYVIIILSVLTAAATDFDPLLISGHSMNSATVKALGDAGTAYPHDVMCGLLNPALVYSSFAKNQAKKVIFTGGYGSDSVFERAVIPAGIVFGGKEGGSLGFFYRGLFGDNKRMQNEFVLNLSGMLTGPSIDEKNGISAGQVNFGTNIRGEYYVWEKRTIGPYNSMPEVENCLIKQKRVLVDMGLYQESVCSNLDFAMTMRNIVGYTWTEENPVLADSTKKVYEPSGDTTDVKVNYCIWGEKKSRDWVEGKYKALTFGIVYHVNPGNSFQLDMPMDFEMLGLFDKHTKNQYIFRGGLAAIIAGHFNLYFGYSRTPGPIKNGWQEIKGINVFTGGAGIALRPVVADFYISKDNFGITASLVF